MVEAATAGNTDSHIIREFPAGRTIPVMVEAAAAGNTDSHIIREFPAGRTIPVIALERTA
jgi:hypothetical protein